VIRDIPVKSLDSPGLGPHFSDIIPFLCDLRPEPQAPTVGPGGCTNNRHDRPVTAATTSNCDVIGVIQTNAFGALEPVQYVCLVPQIGGDDPPSRIADPATKRQHARAK